MTAKQLSLFQQGQDLPLFNAAEKWQRELDRADEMGLDIDDYTAAAPAPTPAGFRDTGERHTYGDNGTYLEVSEEAADERRRRWHEIVGWADGYARVNHPDWIALYDYMLSTCPYMVDCYPEPWRWGPSFLIIVKRPDGTLTHAGSICCRDGQVELNG